MHSDPSRRFTLIPGAKNPEYDPREEPLQSANHIEIFGVLNNKLSDAEIQDAAQSALEFGLAEDERGQTFVRARSVLLGARIITDLNLLDESPSVFSTTRGNMARVISSAHLTALREAFLIEETTPSTENSEKLLSYRRLANETLLKHSETNAVRILQEIDKRDELPKAEMDILYRTVGYVIAMQLERQARARQP